MSRNYKVVCPFPFRPCFILIIDTHPSFWILYHYQVILHVWCFCFLFGFSPLPQVRHGWGNSNAPIRYRYDFAAMGMTSHNPSGTTKIAKGSLSLATPFLPPPPPPPPPKKKKKEKKRKKKKLILKKYQKKTK